MTRHLRNAKSRLPGPTTKPLKLIRYTSDMKAWKLQPWQLFGLALAGLSFASVSFITLGALKNILNGGGFGDWYLLWNLFLAWIPLVLAFFMDRRLRHGSWADWPAIGLSLAWLLFLPNSFYIVSDLIHLEDMPRSDVLFDSLMFSSAVIAGLALGFTSLALVQAQLRRRLSAARTVLAVTGTLLLCSFAIYLGRDLRWNSWDVLVSPAGILFDISERALNPFAYPQAFTVTLSFFAFLSSLYWAIWMMTRAVKRAS